MHIDKKEICKKWEILRLEKEHDMDNGCRGHQTSKGSHIMLDATDAADDE